MRSGGGTITRTRWAQKGQKGDIMNNSMLTGLITWMKWTSSLKECGRQETRKWPDYLNRKNQQTSLKTLRCKCCH